jgi:hypothetical protein
MNKKWFEYYFLSILIHLIILFFLFNKMDFMELRLTRPEDFSLYRLEKQFVNVDDDSSDDVKDAKYLSKSARAVLEETKAKHWGKPENKKEIFSRILEEELSSAIDSYVESREQERSETSYSSTYDYLPEVRPGEETALNTAEFVFYSFYKRVQESIIPVWNREVNNYLKSKPEIMENLRKRDYITELEAFFTPEGVFTKAVILKSSGVSALDNSPGLAFSENSPFDNPPKQMISSDGYIRMKWRFIVSIVGSYKINVERADYDYKDRPDLYHRRSF